MQSLREIFDRLEAKETVFGSLSKRDFHKLTFLIPPRNVIDTCEKPAFSSDQLIENNERQELTLAELHDTLLPKLISSELSAPKAMGVIG